MFLHASFALRSLWHRRGVRRHAPTLVLHCVPAMVLHVILRIGLLWYLRWGAGGQDMLAPNLCVSPCGSFRSQVPAVVFHACLAFSGKGHLARSPRHAVRTPTSAISQLVKTVTQVPSMRGYDKVPAISPTTFLNNSKNETLDFGGVAPRGCCREGLPIVESLPRDAQFQGSLVRRRCLR